MLALCLAAARALSDVALLYNLRASVSSACALFAFAAAALASWRAVFAFAFATLRSLLAFAFAANVAAWAFLSAAAASSDAFFRRSNSAIEAAFVPCLACAAARFIIVCK